MKNRPTVTALAGSLLLLALAASARPAAAAEIKGAAILEHACGKVAVQHMGLVKAGKMEEATKLGTQEMQKEWQAMPAEDRKMMSEMMREMAPAEAQFRADIQAGGLLVVEGKSATLTVTKKIQDASGSGSETMTQRYALDEKGCWISR